MYGVHVSALEVYLDSIYDLLSKRDQALHMRARVVEKTLSELQREVCDLYPRETYTPCGSMQEFEELLGRVASVRMQGSTQMNTQSSRSHLILTLAVKHTVLVKTLSVHTPNKTLAAPGKHPASLGQSLKAGREYMSKLIFVDLAGNERDSARNGLANEADLREEGTAVSRSLSALSACLRERANTSLLRNKDQKRRPQSDSEGNSSPAEEPLRSSLDDDASTQKQKQTYSEGEDHKGLQGMRDNENVKGSTPRRGVFQPGAGIYRTSALTRLLKEPLSTAKIFFLACCSPAASSVATTGQTLQYARMVKNITTSAEDSAVLLEQGMHCFPITFIPHASLLEIKQIPRSDQATNNGLIVFLHEVLRVSVVRVMISHRWLNERHPDNAENAKHKLICALFERLLAKGWIRACDAMDVVDWIDYGNLCLIWCV